MHFCIIIIIIIIIIIKHLLNEYKYEKNILQGKKARGSRIAKQ